MSWRIALGVAVVAALAQNAWALETFVAERSDPLHVWISDLGARDEATGALFNVLDSAGGVAIIALAALFVPAGRATGMLALAGVVALALSGVGTVLDGVLSLDCSKDLDPACSAKLAREGASFRAQAHEVESTITGWLTVAGFALMGLGFGGRIRTASVVCGGAWVALYAVAVAFWAWAGDGDDLKGLFQRAGQVAYGAWLIWIAAGLRRPLATSSGGAVSSTNAPAMKA